MLLRLFVARFILDPVEREREREKKKKMKIKLKIEIIMIFVRQYIHSPANWHFTQCSMNTDNFKWLSAMQSNRVAAKYSRWYLQTTKTIITKVNISGNKWIQSQNYISVNFIGFFVLKIILVIKYSSWRSNCFAFDCRYSFHWKCKLCFHCITSNVPYYLSPPNQ